MATTDIELHQRWLREHDADAFAALVRAHSRMVFATCRRILSNASEAEEVTQDCFWKLARTRQPIHRSAAAWLHTVATREALNRLKSEQRRRVREAQYSAGEPEVESLRWNEVRPYVDEALEALPDSLREPILLHFLEGVTHAELADREGVAQSTISRRIQKGLDQIRRELEGKGVIIPGTALASGLAAESASAVPFGLPSSLIKIAIAGPGRSSAKAATASAFRSTWVSRFAAAGAAVVVGLAILTAVGVVPRSPVKQSRPIAAQRASNQTQAPEPDTISQTVISPPTTENTTPPDTAGDTVAPFRAVFAGASASKRQPANGEPEDRSVTVEGTVTDFQGYPIEGAQVWAAARSGWWQRTTQPTFGGVTDDLGAYKLRVKEPATALVVSAGAPGHSDAFEIVRPDSDTVALRVDFTLQPGATLHGKVVDSSGTGVADAIVRVEGYVLTHGLRQEQRSPSAARSLVGSGGRESFAVTGQDGRFQMGLPLGGIVTLKVDADGDGQSIFDQVPVGAGNEQLLVLRQSSTLFGTVRSATGHAVPGVRVRAAGWFHMEDEGSEGSNNSVSAQTYVGVGDTDAEGRYRMAGLPGGLEYHVRVGEPVPEFELRGDQALSPEVNLGILDFGTERRWDVQLEPMMQVTGRVVGTPSGKPFRRQFNIKYVKGGDRVDVAMNDDSGEFSFQLFESGPYLVYASLNWFPLETQYAYGREVRFEPGQTIDITLTLPDPFSIAVDVVDVTGAPVTDAEVDVVWGTHGQQSTFTMARTDPGGRYEYSSCFPGLTHWFHVSHPGFVAAVSTPAAGAPGDKFPPEQLVLYRGGGIQGVLVDQDNRPIADTALKITILDGGGRSTSSTDPEPRIAIDTHTSGAGVFAVAGVLPEGPAVLAIDAGSQKFELHPIEIQPDAVLDIGALQLRRE